MRILFFILVAILVLREYEGAVPGAYFWKPRMAISLRDNEKPKTSFRVNYPTVKRIKEGRVVLIDGYRLGMTMMTIASVVSDRKPKFAHLDLTSASFYTNAYRWFLRALSLIPEWLASQSAKYPDTHQVWRKRFFYMEEKVPKWLRTLLPFVDDWDQEDGLYNKTYNYTRQYNLYAEPAFGKHYRYPSQVFNNYASFQQTRETVENFDDSDVTQPKNRSFAWGPVIYPANYENREFPKTAFGTAGGTLQSDPSTRDSYLRPVYPTPATMRPMPYIWGS